MKNTLLALSFSLLGNLFAGSAGATESSLAGATPEADGFYKPYRAEYGCKYTFLMPFKGKAIRQLSRLENGEWELTHRITSPIIKLNESSRFNLVNGRPKPLRYVYHQKAFTKKRHIELDFDWQNMTTFNAAKKDPEPYRIEAVTLDKLSYQLALRQELASGKLGSFLVADRNRQKEYRFEIIGEESVDTDVGRLDTLKIRRARGENSSRETIIWLAKDWDYLIVKIHQKEKGKNYEVKLLNAELDGRTVTGVLEG